MNKIQYHINIKYWVVDQYYVRRYVTNQLNIDLPDYYGRGI